MNSICSLTWLMHLRYTLSVPITFWTQGFSSRFQIVPYPSALCRLSSLRANSISIIVKSQPQWQRDTCLAMILGWSDTRTRNQKRMARTRTNVLQPKHSPRVRDTLSAFSDLTSWPVAQFPSWSVEDFQWTVPSWQSIKGGVKICFPFFFGWFFPFGKSYEKRRSAKIC